MVELYAIPDGYKVVPLEPTEEMIAKGMKAVWNIESWASVKSTGKAMIKAALKIEDI